MVSMFFSLNLNKKTTFMGATKANNYNDIEVEIPTLCDGISHPARKRIVDLLDQYKMCRNIDLTRLLNLSGTAVMNHLIKLQRAELIEITYEVHHYEVRLARKRVRKLIEYLESLE